MIIGADGWLDQVRRVDSPNFDARPPGSAVELIKGPASVMPNVWMTYRCSLNRSWHVFRSVQARAERIFRRQLRQR